MRFIKDANTEIARTLVSAKFECSSTEFNSFDFPYFVVTVKATGNPNMSLLIFGTVTCTGMQVSYYFFTCCCCQLFLLLTDAHAKSCLHNTTGGHVIQTKYVDVPLAITKVLLSPSPAPPLAIVTMGEFYSDQEQMVCCMYDVTTGSKVREKKSSSQLVRVGREGGGEYWMECTHGMSVIVKDKDFKNIGSIKVRGSYW